MSVVYYTHRRTQCTIGLCPTSWNQYNTISLDLGHTDDITPHLAWSGKIILHRRWATKRKRRRVCTDTSFHKLHHECSVKMRALYGLAGCKQNCKTTMPFRAVANKEIRTERDAIDVMRRSFCSEKCCVLLLEVQVSTEERGKTLRVHILLSAQNVSAYKLPDVTEQPVVLAVVLVQHRILIC